jgi:signal transduction histidine kinase
LANGLNQKDSLTSYLRKFDYYRVAHRRAITSVLVTVPRLTRDLQALNEAYLDSQSVVERLTKRNYYILVFLILAIALAGFVFWTQRKSKLHQTEITELLRRDFERSQQLNDEKTKYFSILSHELRTPIFAITGLAKLLEDPAGYSKENIDAIINSGNHLLHLVNNVLQHNKLEESGVVILDETDFELLETFTKVLQTTSYLAGQKNIEVVFHNHLLGPQYLNGDKQKLAQILVNLISNAIRYSGRDSKVEVSVSGKESDNLTKEFWFSIRDHGIGIEKSQIPLLFDYRKTTYEVENDSDDNLKGMGIGLFVVANFITAMGSKILVDSKPGEGANFYFDLTFKAGRRVLLPNDGVKRTGKDVNIMVVDDIKINLIVTQKTLTTIGLNCITATDADPVVEMIGKEGVDLILMDLNMPSINGYDLSKKIRQAGILIPIIAHTAVIKENIDHEALRDAKIYDYLIKPYPLEELKEKLTQYLNIGF